MATLPVMQTQTQRLTFHHGRDTHRLIGILRHDASTLHLVLLSPQGQRLLTLVADDDSAKFLPGAAFEPPFAAGWLADRLIWSLWPLPALESSFADSDWDVSQAGPVREIRYRGANIVSIIRDDAGLCIVDHEADYQLAISPLDAPSDAPIPDDQCRKT